MKTFQGTCLMNQPFLGTYVPSLFTSRTFQVPLALSFCCSARTSDSVGFFAEAAPTLSLRLDLMIG